MRTLRLAALPTLLLVLGLLAVALPAQAVSTTLVLNEVDYDQPSADTAEYIEIKNVSGAPISLSGWTLQFINGASGGAVEYQTTDLSNVELAPGDYYVLCTNAGDAPGAVPNCDQPGAFTSIQNGNPDAVVLLQGGVRVDALSYGGTTSGGYVEGTGSGGDSSSMASVGLSRCPDGADTDNNAADWTLRPTTPGGANDCTVPPTPTPTPPPATLEIWQVQAAAHLSPYDGQSVQINGSIVTALLNNGFFMQSPVGDGDVATSDALFVFTSSAPAVAVGDVVNVVGTVDEFQPGSPAEANLTITEITGPRVTVVSSGSALPTPVVLGQGGRVPPGGVIDDDGLTAFEPATDGIDFYESLEAMRVQVNNARVVGPTQSFTSGTVKETWVVADDSAGAGPDTARGGVYITSDDFNPERIQLDARNNTYPGGGAAWPDMNVADRLDGPAVGVVHYSFGNFEVLLTQAVGLIPGNLPRESAAFAGEGARLTVATFNVENLAGNAADSAFASRAGHIVNSLRSPDIVVLEEIQDNNGTANDGTVAADVTFARLIAAIQAAGGPAYEYRQIDPVNNADGGAPGGNIRVGFLFNPARAGFTGRPGGAETPTAVACTDGSAALSFSPGRIDPANSAWAESRKPLVGEFTFNGETVFIVGVHFTSKGGDTPLFGNAQPPVLWSEPQRLAQAAAVNAFVGELLACDPAAAAIVLGDVNDFHFSPVAQALAGDDLINLMTLLPENERYSYVYQGNSQVLDQALASGYLLGRFPDYDVVHANSEFAQQASDHDPSVARFCLDAPATLSVTVDPAWIWPHNGHLVTVNAAPQAGPGDAVRLVSVTSNEADSGLKANDLPGDIVVVNDTTVQLRAERFLGPRVYTLTYAAANGCGEEVTATATVTVPWRRNDIPAGASVSGTDDLPIDDEQWPRLWLPNVAR